MKLTQASRLNMFLAVDNYLMLNGEIVKVLPNAEQLHSSIKKAMQLILGYGEQQTYDKTGIASHKKNVRNHLKRLTIDTSRMVTAHASFIENRVLLSEVKYSESELNRCPDAQLRNIAQGLYSRAQTHLAELASYGITQETQMSLQQAIDEFVTVMPQPRLGITEKAQHTTQLANYYKEVVASLAKLDTVVEIVRTKEPNFYNGYKRVRRVIETGTNTLSLYGSVTDAETGQPIKGAKLEFSLNGNGATAKTAGTAVVIVKKTAQRGGYREKSMQAGVYAYKITKTGYADVTGTVAISNGDRTIQNIKMTKI